MDLNLKYSIFSKNNEIIIFKICGYDNNIKFQNILWNTLFGYTFRCKYGEPETGPSYCTKHINHWDTYANNLNINSNEFTQYWIFPYISDNLIDYIGRGRFLIGLIDSGLEILNANDKFPYNNIFYTKFIYDNILKILIENKNIVFKYPQFSNLNLYIKECNKRNIKINPIFQQFNIIYKIKVKQEEQQSTQTNINNFKDLQKVFKDDDKCLSVETIGLDFCFNLKSLDNFKKFKNITAIDLDSTSITSLVNFPDYEYLDYLSLDDVKISSMYGCPNLINLTYLNLYDSTINTFNHMPNFPKLETLILENTQISSLNNCPEFKNLKELNLNNTKINNLNNFPKLNKLKILYLNNTKISSINEIPELLNLKKLYLNNSDITSLKGLEKFKNLTHLYIINCKKLKDITILNNLKIQFIYL